MAELDLGGWLSQWLNGGSSQGMAEPWLGNLLDCWLGNIRQSKRLLSQGD
jgi:hypothetical protein